MRELLVVVCSLEQLLPADLESAPTAEYVADISFEVDILVEFLSRRDSVTHNYNC